MGNNLFPSLKDTDFINDEYGIKDIANNVAEEVTYPLRFMGSMANFAVGGDYGLRETYEESGKGYKEYEQFYV